MTTEEKARLTLHYIDALSRAQNVEPFREKEITARLIKACDFLEKTVMV